MFTTACPVNAREQKWIEESQAWFRATFGEPRPVVLPGSFTHQDLVTQVCRHMDVDPGQLTVELFGDSAEEDLARAAGLTRRSTGAAGHYRREGGRPVIAVDQTLAPTRLIATIAHELGHVRLDGVHDGADHEPLTDLLTVHFGLGIFTANACFDLTRDNRRRIVRRLGYLTEPMYGYALARHAWLRGERRPTWARYLDVNPRVYLRRGLRYLTTVGQSGEP
ncbi:hypothetical protein GCM10018954_042060 [Kutzneria kofuensis]